MHKPLIFTPIIRIPLVEPGDRLGEIIWNSIIDNHIHIESGDILVITQKIVSKAEGRLTNLASVEPSSKAIEVGAITNKDPRLIELILSESREILRAVKGHIIVEHKLGFVCANAGIDHSNVEGKDKEKENWYLLLPQNPDKSARIIKKAIEKRAGCEIGVLIIDSHGRAWRNGIVGTTIGVAGVPALVDLRGKEDIFGYKLRITQVAAVDELAASASLIMGQADEQIPVVHVRGFPYKLRNSSSKELIRKREKDLFR